MARARHLGPFITWGCTALRMRTGPYDDECSWRGLAPREAFSPSVLLAVRSPSVSSPSSPSLSSPSVVLLGVRSAPADGCTLYIHVVSNHLRAGTYVSKTEESKAAQEVLLYVRARVHSNQRAPVGEHKHMTLGKKVTAIKLIEGQKYPAWIASGHGHFCHACATSARLMFWARNKRELATQPTQRHRGTEARRHRGTEARWSEPTNQLEDVFVCLHLRARTYVSKTEESKAAREVLLYVRARVQSKQRAPVGEHKHMTLGEKVMLA